MDSLYAAAARALAAGDPLGALDRVALRDDAPALALRGLAMAQLGDLGRAKELLERATRGFSPRETVARARCEVACAEVSLARRDPMTPSTDARLLAAARVLGARGDQQNAIHARWVILRRALLAGRLDRVVRTLGETSLDGARPTLVALFELVRAEVALRRVRTREAVLAFDRAHAAAARSGVPALIGEVERSREVLTSPAAMRVVDGAPVLLDLVAVERLFDGGACVIDACARALRMSGESLALARRPILFALLRVLGEAWPGDATREALLAAAFDARRVDDSHRARLRVEIGRLRRLLGARADVVATPRGFVLEAADDAEVIVIVPPIDGSSGAILGLLADGAAWSTSALAHATGQSQRNVQRSLAELLAADRVRALGGGRTRRWLAQPTSRFATTLLLPTTLPDGLPITKSAATRDERMETP